MPNVTITVNNRDYQIACDVGQESRVQALGDYVAEHANGLSDAAGTENYQLVLTALMLADEVFDMRDQMNAAQAQIQQEVNVRAQALDAKLNAQRAQMAATANGLAEQLELIANRLKSA